MSEPNDNPSGNDWQELAVALDWYAEQGGNDSPRNTLSRVKDHHHKLVASLKHFIEVCNSNGYCKRGHSGADSPPLARAKALVRGTQGDS